jgi:molybdopterin converting factor small subunit
VRIDDLRQRRGPGRLAPVDSADVRHEAGMETPLREESTVRVVAAIAGG